VADNLGQAISDQLVLLPHVLYVGSLHELETLALDVVVSVANVVVDRSRDSEHSFSFVRRVSKGDHVLPVEVGVVVGTVSVG